MKLAKIFSLLLILQLSAFVQADVSVSSYYIPGFIENKNKGLFIEFNQEVFSRIEQPVDVIFEPAWKAKISFFTGKTDILFPELDEGLNKFRTRGDFVKSAPFWKKKVLIFSLKSSPYSSLETLYGKPIGAIRGYSYGPTITDNPHLSLHYIHNDNMGIKMLLAGKITGLLGDAEATKSAIIRAGAEHLIYTNMETPVEDLDVFYVCHNNNKGIELCDAISSAIQSLKNEGYLKSIQKKIEQPSSHH